MCLKILTQGRSPLLSVKISLFGVFKQLLTLHKLTLTSDATSVSYYHDLDYTRVYYSGAVVTFGLVRFLTFGALKVCYDVDTFQPMKIHVSKIMNLHRCENEITVFIGFYLDYT